MSNKFRISPLPLILLLPIIMGLIGCTSSPTPSPTTAPTSAPPRAVASPTPSSTTTPTAVAKEEQKKDENSKENEYPLAYDFTAKDLLTGKKFALSDFRGKIVFLNFWGSWCPPCRMEMPSFQKVYEKYDNQVIIIGVGINDSPGNLIQFAKSINVTYPITHDRTSEIARHYRIRSLPTTYRIDQEGRIRGVAMGALSEEQLTKAIEELLNQQ